MAEPSVALFIAPRSSDLGALRRTLEGLGASIRDARRGGFSAPVDAVLLDRSPSPIPANVIEDLPLPSLDTPLRHDHLGPVRLAEALNEGLARCATETVLLWCERAFPAPTMLSALMRELAAHPGTGVAQPRPIPLDPSLVRDGPAGVQTCASLVRRSIWDDVGGLDTGLDHAASELDLADRTVAQGFAVRTAADAVFVHDDGFRPDGTVGVVALGNHQGSHL